MRYKVEVSSQKPYNPLDADSVAANRFPPLTEIKSELEQYIKDGQGLIILHKSLYEYRYDTRLTDYHRVDSIGTIGHIDSVVIENGKLFIIVEMNDNFVPDKKYICFYRSTMQSDPLSTDRTLHISHLFAVDLVTVLETELTDSITLSTIEVYEA